MPRLPFTFMISAFLAAMSSALICLRILSKLEMMYLRQSVVASGGTRSVMVSKREGWDDEEMEVEVEVEAEVDDKGWGGPNRVRQARRFNCMPRIDKKSVSASTVGSYNVAVRVDASAML